MKGDSETNMHILVRCPFAVQCWQSSYPDVLSVVEESFSMWMGSVFDKFSAKERAEIAMIC